jgi:hypothetical protein
MPEARDTEVPCPARPVASPGGAYYNPRRAATGRFSNAATRRRKWWEAEAMAALEFVQSLAETGRVRVGADPGPPARLDEAVRELDRLARPHLAFDPPPVAPAVAGWALLALYRACQSLVYREIEADAVREALSRPCPQPPPPLPPATACYSADLAFRFLPDLIGLARGVAEQDPLVEGLNVLAAAWPLSSVGVRGLGGLDVSPFIGHPSLRRLYADRIIDRADASRLDDPLAREAVREALGVFLHLAPRAIAAAIEAREVQEAHK